MKRQITCRNHKNRSRACCTDFAMNYARQLERENSILFDFINREMKMTASDPRIQELAARIAEHRWKEFK